MGYELYAENALNLAMSIKAFSPKVNITLIHDDCVNVLTEKEKTFFDVFKPAKPEDYIVEGKPQYQRLKVCVDKYSDYEDSLYIDVDSIWFPNKDINVLFDKLENRDFFIGYNGDYDPLTKKRTNRNYTYWIDNPRDACNYFNLKSKLPQTVSGTFFFKRNDYTAKIFELSREVYDDPKAPHIRWAAGKPDEYCFNVALSKAGYTQEEMHFLYFEKINGPMTNERIYSSFWGLAAGGNKLQPHIKRLYNELVSLFSEHFEVRKHFHIDKKILIPERADNV